MKIERLEIQTENLVEQLKFYKETLGLETFNRKDNSFELKIGFSILKIIEDKQATPYHIAFHIPPFQEGLALEWIKQRGEVQRNGMEEIIDFSAWKARSLYFYDADRNILEFISRKDLYPVNEKKFTEKSILGVAEIGLATTNIEEKFKTLNKTCELEKFDGNFDNFCAIGDDEGLIITIDKNKKDWFPTNDEAFVSDFDLTFEHEDLRYSLNFKKDMLSINRHVF